MGEEHSLDSLFLSKGEECRVEQDNIGKEVDSSNQGIREEDLHNLIAKNCPDLLANFGDAGDLGLDSLEIGKKKEKEKKEQKSSSPSRSSNSGSQSVPEQSQSSKSGSPPPLDQMPHWFP